VTAGVVVGVLVGLGLTGILYGTVAVAPSLDTVARDAVRKVVPARQSRGTNNPLALLHGSGMGWARDVGILEHPSWSRLSAAFAITGTSPDLVVAQVFAWVGAGLVLPPVLWGLGAVLGISVPLGVPVLLAAVLVIVGVFLPFAQLREESTRRRRHVRIVVGSYVDLVVLCLAGGAGIESALVAAAEVSSDWASQRLGRTLLLARDSGQAGWLAIGDLGRQWDVPELCELASTLQLAGTEGARVRQALTARAVSLRRHEQADAESAANAMTERLFFPGALLLVGFLLFIGYPAFSRILGGF